MKQTNNNMRNKNQVRSGFQTKVQNDEISSRAHHCVVIQKDYKQIISNALLYEMEHEGNSNNQIFRRSNNASSS